MVKIMILTAMHKRYGIAELFCDTIKRFIGASPFETKCFSGVSDNRLGFICEHKVLVRCVENFSVSMKWNNTLRWVKDWDWDWDYLFIIGDDDVMDIRAWDYYKPYIERGEDFFGLRSIYYYHPLENKAMTFKYPFDKLIGSGRFLSRKLVEDCFPLWEDGLNSGLDKSCDTKLALKGYNPIFIETPAPMILDIKSEQNIWRYGSYAGHGQECDVNKAEAFFTADELKFLKSLDAHGNVKLEV